jgi:hypothetical protein
MIYDPITRQQVKIIGRHKPQTEMYRMGRKERTDEKHPFRFVRVEYGDYVAKWAREKGGGYDLGHVKDVELNYLVADKGIREIDTAYDSAPEVQ